MARHWWGRLSLVALFLAGALIGGGRPALAASAAAPAQAGDPRFFTQTNYRIDSDTIWDYFNRRGGVSTFGYPVSRTFLFRGNPVQFFQRRIVEIGPDGGARPLNLLDPGLLPYSSFNYATFPGFDGTLVASAPSPTDAAAVLAFVQAHAPDSFEGLPVNFYSDVHQHGVLPDRFSERRQRRPAARN